MSKYYCHCLAAVFLAASVAVRAQTPDAGAQWSGVFQTPVRHDLLDPASFAEWVGGKETPVPNPSGHPNGTPAGVVWSADLPQQRLYGLEFGGSKEPGARHLRVGFKQPIGVGSILAGGDIAVSVLKSDAPYPGDLSDDSQWIPAERLGDGQVTNEGLKTRDDVALWVLPPHTTTQAIRFSRSPSSVADATETGKYSAFLQGAYVLADRLANLAPGAIAVAGNSNDKAAKVINGARDNFWSGWENIAPGSAASARPLGEASEWLLLAWPRPVSLRGLALISPLFTAADVQIFKGSESVHPRDAREGDWQTLLRPSALPVLSPLGLPVNWLDFGGLVQTRAVRLRITAAADKQQAFGGKRVGLAELLAVQPLGENPFDASVVAAMSPVPGGANGKLIPVKFTLPEDGFVTLVIEDSAGRRVRNLVSETPFKKGANIAWWDGANDLNRDFDAARHGVSHIPKELVAPGAYKVRGLWRKEIDYRYEFSVYGSGNPPWFTANHTGGWLANQTPPQSAVFVPADRSPTGAPALFLGAFITEGPDGFIWTDLDGKKRGGRRWLGGAWTAAPYLARDDGDAADRSVPVYVASVGPTGNDHAKFQLRVTAFKAGMSEGEKASFTLPIPAPPTKPGESMDVYWEAEIGGLAVRNGLAVCSMTRTGKLIFVDMKTGRFVGEAPLENPHGSIFDSQGNLLVLSGTKLLRFEGVAGPELPEPTVLIEGLEDPRGITLDAEGSIYLSDRGDSHQVKIFTPEGKPVRTIGKPGRPQAGPYDPMRMNNPAGLAVDSSNQLWVAENDHLPKRVSVWSRDGKLVRAFYGPSKYGGGGMLDPTDRSIFYHADNDRGVMQFRLDWEKGTSELVKVLYRADRESLKLPTGWHGGAAPEFAIYRGSGDARRRYMVNCFNSNPVEGLGTTFIFAEVDGTLRPVAGAGLANCWPLLKKEEFATRWPGAEFRNETDPWNGSHRAFFLWSDLNNDGDVQPGEVSIHAGSPGGVTVMPDFSICVSHVGDKAMRFSPVNFTDDGIPVYDFASGRVLAQGVIRATSSGGSQVLMDGADDGMVITLGVKPFPASSLCGGEKGAATWSYPSLWPGLHASHESPKPESPGEVIGTTRLLGGFVNPAGSEVGPLWGINGNMGNCYLFTRDGLFVATLFEDMRLGKLWDMPLAPRGMSLKGVSPKDEHFFPTINQTPEGDVYLVYQAEAPSLVKLEGLETLRRLPGGEITITADDLKQVQAYHVAREEETKEAKGRGVLSVTMRKTPPAVDGKVGDWEGAQWAEIDRKGVAAYFSSDSKPYDIRGAVAVANGNLYAAWKTGDPNLLQNSGELPVALFKTGGTLELMIASNPKADPRRREAAAGDMRLLVTQVDGKVRALIYRPVVPGTPADKKIPFVSPARALVFDQVEDVSDKVRFAADGAGDFEIAIPLAVLGLEPAPGARIQADIGVLRGNGTQTVARVYWSNKATGIVSDLPSEAELVPSLWGIWEFTDK